MPISTASLFDIDKNITWFLNPIRISIVLSIVLCLCIWIVLTDVTSDELMRIGIGTFGLSCVTLYLHHAATMKNLTKNITNQDVRNFLNSTPSHQLTFDATSSSNEVADVEVVTGGEEVVSSVSSSDF